MKKIVENIRNHPIDVTIRVSVLALIIYYSFEILGPFIQILIWSLIISIAIFPIQRKLSELLGNRKKISAALVTLAMLTLIILPITILAEELVRNFSTIKELLSSNTLDIPPPALKIKDISLVGDILYENWHEASENLEAFILHHSKELEKIGLFLFGSVAAAGKGLFLFIAAVIVSGVLLVYASNGLDFAKGLSNKLAGENGVELVQLAENTTRSVVSGVLGVAIIQSSLAGLGFVVVGIPFWGILVMLSLFLTLIQIGVFPIVIPAVIYVFVTQDTSTAVIFLIWNILVLISDNILKPLLLGRGTKVPALVVFLGAVGGFIHSGFLGLFIGPVVLSLSYQLLNIWMKKTEVLQSINSETDEANSSPT